MGIFFATVDIESTGLKVGYHEINQIAVVRYSDKKSICVDIAVEYPYRAQQAALDCQQKTIADLKRGIKLADAVAKIDAFISEEGETPAHRCMVAHNAAFDRKFCQAAWQSCKKEFPADLWLCSISLAKLYVKKNPAEGVKIAKAQQLPKVKYSLNPLLEGIGITPKIGAHDASVDTFNTDKLLEFLLGTKTEYVSLIKRIPQNTESNDISESDY